jgi:ketosteroid isomerase-like protein
MLDHLGRRDYAGCASYLADDVYADWPYRPMPNLPDQVTGKKQLIGYFRGEAEGSTNEGMDEYTPLSYEIDNIIELEDPNSIVAEYRSSATHIPSGKPYRNRYISILKFQKGKITYWREYVNPAPIYEIYDMIKPIGHITSSE